MKVNAFVDIHMHGCAGIDVGTADTDGLSLICRTLAAHGTCAFLPTVPAVTPEMTVRALSLISRKMREQEGVFGTWAEKGNDIYPEEALILGAHLEGPFLLPAFKGALDENVFLPATVENWHKITGEYENIVRRVTIDPLSKGAMDLISYLSSRGVSVTCGHTAADSDTVLKAFKAGATGVTHLFNAMPSLHHRSPGPVGAALSDDECFAELICDFLHVDRLAVKAAVKAKGSHKVAVITDSCEAAGMPDGIYQLSGREIRVINGEARLEDGRLASSTVFMDKERLNLLSIGFGERDIASMTHFAPLECMKATPREKYLLSRVYAVLNGDGTASGLTVIRS